MSEDTFKRFDQLMDEMFLDSWYRLERLEERYAGRTSPVLTKLPPMTTPEERQAARAMLEARLSYLERLVEGEE
jgi:hypothetical protein